MILVTWFVMRVLHGLRPRWLTSVVPRMRWKFFAVCLGLAVVALVAQVAVGSVLPGEPRAGSAASSTTSPVDGARRAGGAADHPAAGGRGGVRLPRLPAAGGRVPVPQPLGRHRATGLLFALAHGVQNFPLFFDRFAFGLIAAWLVIRTGGLEAGIALHVLNNFLAFGLALSFGDISETLNVTEASWWNIVLTITQSAVYAALVLYVARRMGLQTLTRPPSTQPGPASTGTVDGSLTTA